MGENVVLQNPDEHPVNVNGLTAFPSRVAAFMPHVQGRCPSCGMRSLFLASGGYVTCASLSCLDPSAASDVLQSAPSAVARTPDDGAG